MKVEVFYIFYMFLLYSPHPFQCITPLTHPPPETCIYFLILQKESVLPKYALMYGLLLQSDQPTRSYTLRGDCLSLPQQLTIISHAMDYYGLVSPTAFLCWDFSGLSFHRFGMCCHNFCVQMPCCVQKMIFLPSHPNLCLLLSFSSSSAMVLEPWEQQFVSMLLVVLRIKILQHLSFSFLFLFLYP